MSRFTRRSVIASASAAGLAACAPKGQSMPESATPSSIVTNNFEDGTALASKIRSGETSSLALVEAAGNRLASVNDRINAIASLQYEDAVEVANSPPSGPFAGVPTFIKDLVEWKGAPCMHGSRAFKEYMPDRDAPIAAKWRAAGVVSLGKSTTPEEGFISSTEPLVTGPTRNPWDTDRIPGGSSGGAAALVAARVVPFAQASDGGGSIRIPASTCGIFGLKPSAGRTASRSHGPKPPVEISVQHAVTISVRDSIGLFKCAETLDGFEPLGDIAPLNRKLKIGLCPKFDDNAPLSPDTLEGLESAAQLCRDLGHDVIEFRPAFDVATFTDKFLLLWAAGAGQFAQDAARFTGKPIGPDILEPWTLGLAQMAAQRLNELPETIGWLQAFSAVYNSWYESIDVLLTPVTSAPAVLIGEQAPTVEFDVLKQRVIDFAGYTSPMNVSGAASMSVPLHWTAGGLPVGAMFSARKGEDALLFELALQLEDARPWVDRIPPVSAI